MISVRLFPEWVSVKNRFRCPLISGISVRITPDYTHFPNTAAVIFTLIGVHFFDLIKLIIIAAIIDFSLSILKYLIVSSYKFIYYSIGHSIVLWVWGIGTLIYFIIAKPWWMGAYALGYFIFIGSIIGLPGIIIVDGIAGKILGRHPKYYAAEKFYSKLYINESENLDKINNNVEMEEEKEKEKNKEIEIDKNEIKKLIQDILKEHDVLEANDLRNQLMEKLGKNITATKFSLILKEMNELKQLKYNEPGLVQPNTKVYNIIIKVKDSINNSKIYCKYCGKELPDYAIYCNSCGEKN